MKDEQLQKEFSEANAAAIKAMRETGRLVSVAGSDGNRQLRYRRRKSSARCCESTEGVEVRLDELEESVAEIWNETRQHCARLARLTRPGKHSTSVWTRRKRTSRPAAPVEMARKQLTDLKAFIAEKKVVTIPGTEEALVAEAPAYRRWNFAYINIPGPYEKSLPSTYYIAPPDPSWSQQEKDAYRPGRRQTCFSLPFTKFGPATSCSSFMRTGPSRSLARCLLVMHSPKAGPTTRKK